MTLNTVKTSPNETEIRNVCMCVGGLNKNRPNAGFYPMLSSSQLLYTQLLSGRVLELNDDRVVAGRKEGL